MNILKCALTLVMHVRKININRLRKSEAQFGEIGTCFSRDMYSKKIAILIKVNRNKVECYIFLFRKRVADICETETYIRGVVKGGESYFCRKKIRGNPGKGAAGKTPVLESFSEKCLC